MPAHPAVLTSKPEWQTLKEHRERLEGVLMKDLFDKDPVASPQTNTGLDINPALYDTLGRIYRAGVRFNF